MAVIRVLYASLFVTLPQLIAVSSSPCGRIARPDPQGRGAPGWQLCYIKLPEDRAHASTRCSDLVSDLQPTGTDITFPSSQALLDAGGSFGCWYDDEGLNSAIQNACKPNKGHQVSITSHKGRNILGLCIQYPPGLPEPAAIAQTSVDASCGSIARPDPQGRGAPGWQLCYIKLPEDEAYASTTCSDLVSDLQPTETDLTFANSQALLDAGGDFGCWYATGGLNSAINKACVPNRGHHESIANHEGSDILGLCIQYPPGLPEPALTTTLETSGDPSCGSIARRDPLAREPPGWVLCYILPDDQTYINTKCVDLVKNITDTDAVYQTADDLLDAGGQFGCWYDKGGLEGSLVKACEPNKGHHVSLSSHNEAKVLGLCIQLPSMITSTAVPTPRETKEDPGATWMVVGVVLAVLLILALAALSVLVYRRFHKKKPVQPPAMGLVSLLSSRQNSGEPTHVYCEETPSKCEAGRIHLRRLPSVPGEEKIYEEIPERTVSDDYEVPVPSPRDRNAMTAQNHLYMDMAGAEGLATTDNTCNKRLIKQNLSGKVPRGASPDEASANTEDRYANMH